jgi:hypothetical protein
MGTFCCIPVTVLFRHHTLIDEHVVIGGTPLFVDQGKISPLHPGEKVSAFPFREERVGDQGISLIEFEHFLVGRRISSGEASVGYIENIIEISSGLTSRHSV